MSACTGETPGAPGDRLLVEKLDSGGDGTVDQTTTYAYGENADLTDPANPVGGDGTRQTLKTIWQGQNTDPGPGAVKLGETTYTFNRQGRLWIAEIDSDGNGDLESRSEYTYDHSGIRVSKTETEDTDGDGDLADETPETTLDLVDHHNPTGYQQVLEEIAAATMAVIKSHVLGLDVISQQGPSIASGAPLFFLYDGHGSTRALLDPAGQILPGQIYAYDAYGNAHGFDPAAALTSLLYSGEQFDQRLAMQYLRARYYDPATGRFNRVDPFAGSTNDPQSLHKYLYVHADPVMGIDPSGRILGLVGGFFCLGFGVVAGTFVHTKYDSVVVSVGGGVIGAGIAYVGFIQMGNIARQWRGGRTTTVNIYFSPLVGTHGGDPDFVDYRRYLVEKTGAMAQRLNGVNPGNTTFTIINGPMPNGIVRGYDRSTKTMNIPLEWSDGSVLIAQGLDWHITAMPKGFDSQLQFWVDAGTIQKPTDDEKATYLANMLLHETAHVVLSRSPFRQWGGYRDHTASGLMGGVIFGENMSFEDASTSIWDYDPGTKAEMRSALGWQWAWF